MQRCQPSSRSITLLFVLSLLSWWVARTEAQALPKGVVPYRLGADQWRHAAEISFVAVMPDCKSVLTASRDHVIRLWDLQNGTEIRRFASTSVKQPFRPHLMKFYSGSSAEDNGRSCVTVSADGKVVAACLPNNVIQLWDISTGKEQRRFKHTDGLANAVRFSPSGKLLAIRGSCQETTLMDVELGEERQVHKDPNDGTVSPGANGGIAFSPDGDILAIGMTGADQVKNTTFVRLVDVNTGKEIRRFATQKNCAAVAFSPDGALLAYGCLDRIHLCNWRDGKEIRQIKAPAMITGLAFVGNRKTLAGKAMDRIVRVWNTYSGELQKEWGDKVDYTPFLHHGASEQRDMAVSADGKTLAWGDGQTVRVWDVAAGKDLAPPTGHRAAVVALNFSADSRTLLSYGEDETLRRWDLTSGKSKEVLPVPPGTTIAAFSPEGQLAALANSDESIRILDTSTGKERRHLPGHRPPNADRLNHTVDLTFTKDGKILASQGSFDCLVRLHDSASGRLQRQIWFGDSNAATVLSPDFLVRGGLGLAFSPEGKTIAACETRHPGRATGEAGWYTAKIRRWDVATGKELQAFTLPARRLVTQIAYSPDGRLLAAVHADFTISLYEAATGKERALLGKPQPSQLSTAWTYQRRFEPAPPRTLTFSPDGRLLLSRSPVDVVRVWDVHAAQEIGQINGHQGAVLAAGFSPDGRRFVTGGNDTSVLVSHTHSWPLTLPLQRQRIGADELKDHWDQFLTDDAAKAFKLIQQWSASPKDSVPFLALKVVPVNAATEKDLHRLIGELENGDFRRRIDAVSKLEGLGDLALPALQRAHAGATLEARRRIEALLEKLTPTALGVERTRIMRAVEILERTGTKEARRLLGNLASGAPDAFLTQQATAALDRLTRFAAVD